MQAYEYRINRLDMKSMKTVSEILRIKKKNRETTTRYHCLNQNCLSYGSFHIHPEFYWLLCCFLWNGLLTFPEYRSQCLMMPLLHGELPIHDGSIIQHAIIRLYKCLSPTAMWSFAPGILLFTKVLSPKIQCLGSDTKF